MKKLLLLYGLLLIGIAQADTWYRWVDKSGSVHYSDAPPADATEVQKQRIGAEPLVDDAYLPYETRRAQQDFPVTLYVIENCGDVCQQARDLLRKRGVPFSENSLKTQEEFEAFKKMSGSASVPVLAVGKAWLRNFQPEQWDGELDIAGYPKLAPYRPPIPVKKVKPDQASEAIQEETNPVENMPETAP